MKAGTCFEVDLYFSATNLMSKDTFSKSDPFLTMAMQQSMHGNVQPLGRTETQPNTTYPTWNQKITAQYYFEVKQYVLLEVYDQDSTIKAQFIGKAQTSLGAIMGAHLQMLHLDLMDHHGKIVGKVTARAQKVQGSSFTLSMKWRGTKLANVDSFMSKSDPYLKFLKVRQDNTLIEIGRTEYQKNNQQPSWGGISLAADKLFDINNPYASFKVQCWDHEEGNKPHRFIGEAFVSTMDLKNKQLPMEYVLANSKINKAGILYLQSFQMMQRANFVDFLQSGLQLNLVIGIDFTGSNGVPKQPNSLHYISKPPTQYQLVMKSIWDIIQNYDSDKRIPAFGFGAKPQFQQIRSNTVNHCFAINDNPQNPQIQGFQNLMNCYTHAVNNMQFSGPTHFAPLIRQAFAGARRLINSYSYQILLILTDGQIHDMKDTKDLIVQNSNVPLSIIIVGIGNSDFGNMVQLDGDSRGIVSSQGQKCPRDIIQFVPFNKFNGNAQVLGAELLREIPNQVSQYFNFVGMKPQPQNMNMGNNMGNNFGNGPNMGQNMGQNFQGQNMNMNMNMGMGMGQNMQGQNQENLLLGQNFTQGFFGKHF